MPPAPSRNKQNPASRKGRQLGARPRESPGRAAVRPRPGCALVYGQVLLLARAQHRHPCTFRAARAAGAQAPRGRGTDERCLRVTSQRRRARPAASGQRHRERGGGPSCSTAQCPRSPGCGLVSVCPAVTHSGCSLPRDPPTSPELGLGEEQMGEVNQGSAQAARPGEGGWG